MRQRFRTEGCAFFPINTRSKLLLRLRQHADRLLHAVLEARAVFDYGGFEGKRGKNHRKMLIPKNGGGKRDDILIS